MKRVLEDSVVVVIDLDIDECTVFAGEGQCPEAILELLACRGGDEWSVRPSVTCWGWDGSDAFTDGLSYPEGACARGERGAELDRADRPCSFGISGRVRHREAVVVDEIDDRAGYGGGSAECRICAVSVARRELAVGNRRCLRLDRGFGGRGRGRRRLDGGRRRLDRRRRRLCRRARGGGVDRRGIGYVGALRGIGGVLGRVGSGSGAVVGAGEVVGAGAGSATTAVPESPRESPGSAAEESDATSTDDASSAGAANSPGPRVTAATTAAARARAPTAEPTMPAVPMPDAVAPAAPPTLDDALPAPDDTEPFALAADEPEVRSGGMVAAATSPPAVPLPACIHERNPAAPETPAARGSRTRARREPTWRASSATMVHEVQSGEVIAAPFWSRGRRACRGCTSRAARWLPRTRDRSCARRCAWIQACRRPSRAR